MERVTQMLLLFTTSVWISAGHQSPRSISSTLESLKTEISSLHHKINQMQIQIDGIYYKIDQKQCHLDDYSVDKIVSRLSGWGEQHPPRNAQDCIEYYEDGSRSNAVYKINIDGEERRVFCDMQTDGGGWMVFQRRTNGSISFERTWQEYKTGFGDLTSDFWMGNDVLHQITNGSKYILRIDLEDFEGNKAFAQYDSFYVASENERYQMNVGDYSGNAGDSFRVVSSCNDNEGLLFSTKDQKLEDVNSHCFLTFQDGWWINDCSCANLNGVYYNAPIEFDEFDGIVWYSWKRIKSLKFTEMKIRLSNTFN